MYLFQKHIITILCVTGLAELSRENNNKTNNQTNNQPNNQTTNQPTNQPTNRSNNSNNSILSMKQQPKLQVL
jgi:hypothetical protein